MKTFKQFIENIKGNAKKQIAIVTALVALTGVIFLATGATQIGVLPSQTAPVVNSSLGCSTNGSTATNLLGAGNLALYPLTINSNGVTCTNLVCLNPSGSAGNEITVQATFSQLTAMATNVTFVLSQSLVPITITNSTPLGFAGSAAPRSPIGTYTLAFDGTITTITTNLTLTPNTTPPWNGKVFLYLERIGNGAGTAILTNYFFYVGQN